MSVNPASYLSKIEAEKTLLDGNRDLFDCLNQKTDIAIARVWGEAQDEGSAR
jgi:hypothetical protein